MCYYIYTKSVLFFSVTDLIGLHKAKRIFDLAD